MRIFFSTKHQRRLFTAPALMLGFVMAALPMVAFAARLQVSGDASTWAQLGADALLYLHIGGGTLGLVFGAIAIFAKKGARVHRFVGRVFFASMFVAYLVGGLVAPFLNEGQRPNFIASILALTLLITGVLAAKRRNPSVGWIEYVGLLAALSVVVAGVIFMLQGANDPTGTVDGSPPQAFILFIVIGSVCVLEDAWLCIKGRITGATRLSRHLWRMCMSLFIASGSFFFGQQQMLPSELVGTFWQVVPVLLPLVAMLTWLVLVRFPNARFVGRNQA